MKDRIILNIVKGKTFLNVYHMGNLIGKIEIAEKNGGSNVSLRIHGNKDETFFKVEKENQEKEKGA